MSTQVAGRRATAVVACLLLVWCCMAAPFALASVGPTAGRLGCGAASAASMARCLGRPVGAEHLALLERQSDDGPESMLDVVSHAAQLGTATHTLSVSDLTTDQL